jgi:predicted Rossmann-fold nucleotide-binding protein
MSQKEEKDKSHFRVSIFGSARIEKGTPIYDEIYNLSKLIAQAEMDIVTGGGPGLMNSASEGHHAGRKSLKTHSIGLGINLPFKQKEAVHLDIKREFDRFSKRLDNFMQFSNAVVVAPGGVGTLLELLYTWQLMQVKQICHIPIILLGEMWLELVRWIKEWPLKSKLLDEDDVELFFLAKNCGEAFAIIEEAHKRFKEGDEQFCLNYKKYKI